MITGKVGACTAAAGLVRPGMVFYWLQVVRVWRVSGGGVTGQGRGGVRADLLGELVALRSDLQHVWGSAWLALAGLTACTGWTLAGTLAGDRAVPGSRITAVLTIGFAVAWVLVDTRLEGPVLLVFSKTHGLSLSDLAAVVGVLVAGLRLFRR